MESRGVAAVGEAAAEVAAVEEAEAAGDGLKKVDYYTTDLELVAKMRDHQRLKPSKISHHQHFVS